MARQVGVFRYFLVMPIRFAINGVGRIGRALIRVAHQRPDLELVAINDLASADQIAPLLAHDSLHGAFAGEVRSNGDGIEIDGLPRFRGSTWLRPSSSTRQGWPRPARSRALCCARRFAK